MGELTKGTRVRFLDRYGDHDKTPFSHPARGTEGTVIISGNFGMVKVQWPKGSTSDGDRYWVSIRDLEVLEDD